MISFRHKGNFSKTEKYLRNMKAKKLFNALNKYGQEGVAVLMSATPIDTGKTAMSWRYEIVQENGSIRLIFCNDNIQNGVPIAIILQYGHGTRNGGWVQGRDYINPAMQPIFDKIADDAWREVTRL